jgi:hypothetical protein
VIVLLRLLQVVLILSLVGNHGVCGRESLAADFSDMLNLYEGVRTNPGYNKLEIDDFIFAEYTCGIGAEKLGLWTHKDYLVNVVTGKKTWHTAEGVWRASPGETLFFKKGAAIVEQHFEIDFCLLMFFIPDDLVRSTVREIAGSLAGAPARIATIKSAVRV